VYEQSLLTLGGAPNPASRLVHRGAFDFGGGVDTKLWRWIGLRVRSVISTQEPRPTTYSALEVANTMLSQAEDLVVKWGE